MKTKTHLVSYVTVLVVASVTAECRKDTDPPVGPRPRASTPAATPPPSPSAVDSGAPTATAAAEQLAELDAGLGDWVESTAYKFKVTAVQRCAEPQGQGRTPSDASTPEDRPVRVGVVVHVFSKYDELFVSGRDVTIEKGGVIIQSEVNPEPSAGCAALLQPKTMRHDQVNSGVVVFQLPDESFAQSGIVAYKATRWGGAPRVEVKLVGTQLALPKGAAASKPRSK